MHDFLKHTMLSIILTANNRGCDTSRRSHAKSIRVTLTHGGHILASPSDNYAIEGLAKSRFINGRLGNVESQEVQPQLANVGGARADFGVTGAFGHTGGLEISAIFVFDRGTADGEDAANSISFRARSGCGAFAISTFVFGVTGSGFAIVGLTRVIFELLENREMSTMDSDFAKEKDSP